MKLVIRGHVRDSFQTNVLLDFVKTLCVIVPDLTIYIHTWDIVSNSLSWRPVPLDLSRVTEDVVYSYFSEVKERIRWVCVDSDVDLPLVGRVTGYINGGPMPILGWKNYWFGQYKALRHVLLEGLGEAGLSEAGVGAGEAGVGLSEAGVGLSEAGVGLSEAGDLNPESVLNMRFDLFTNFNYSKKTRCLDFVWKHAFRTDFTENVFMFEKEHTGIDNLFIGNAYTQYRLARAFHFELDSILRAHPDTIHQEFIVFRVNKGRA